MKNNYYTYYDNRLIRIITLNNGTSTESKFRRKITLNAASTESMFLSLYDDVSYENKYFTNLVYIEKVFIGHLSGQIICSLQFKDICRSKNFLELVGKNKNEQLYYVMANISNSTNIKINYNDLDTVLKDSYFSELYRSRKYKLFLIVQVD